MLDTDTCSYIMKRSSEPVDTSRLQAVPVTDVCMSIVTKSELLYGVEVSPRRTQDAAALAAFLPYVEVPDFTGDAAHQYAAIRADLKRRGALIGGNDFVHCGARAQFRSDNGDKQHCGVRTREGPCRGELDIALTQTEVSRRSSGAAVEARGNRAASKWGARGSASISSAQPRPHTEELDH